MPASQTLLLARWIAPMDRAPLRDGGVVVRADRILDVGSGTALRQAYRGARIIDLDRSIILPGLVNAHVHLELSACEAGPAPGGHFTDWILSIGQRMQLTDHNLPEVVGRSISIGLRQCRAFGVTAVGDISQHSHITRPMLRDEPLRCVSFGEVLGIGGLRPRYDALLPRALDESHASQTLRIGLTPHAPYTVEAEQYRQCLRLAQDRDLPLATHLAETQDEEEFLRHHRGPFRDVHDRLGLWQEGISRFEGSPVRFAHELGLLGYPTLLAHVNFCNDEDLELLARGRASIVYCPRTHLYFDHPPHRWREILDRGVNLAVGTDSCASSPDLNLVDDLRLLRRLAPDLPAIQLWELATTRAARALWLDEQIGSLAPGKRADLAIFDAGLDSDPLEAILHDARTPAQTWFAGRPID